MIGSSLTDQFARGLGRGRIGVRGGGGWGGGEGEGGGLLIGAPDRGGVMAGGRSGRGYLSL